MLAVAGALCSAGIAAQATEFGTVVSSTPVNSRVAVPQRQCYDQVQEYAAPTTGAGAVSGAIIGGVLGSTVGHGAATALGAVAGAVVGDSVEANNTPPQAATVRRCQTVSRYENRVVAYDVDYDYNGTRYTARMYSPPGDRIALNSNLTPQDIAPPAQYASTTVTERAPVYVAQAPTVVYADPVYAAPLVYAGPRIWIGGGWGWGWGGHRGWR
jgi:uncharacterized protein YcfJ